MAEFEIAFDETLLNEGGYVNDPDDRGGETYRGIARAFHGTWPGWKIIDRLKNLKPPEFEQQLNSNQQLQDLVQIFYRENFWMPVRGDQISSQHLANELFDTAVNQGVKTAIKFWQESLNLLNRNQRDYPDILVDGIAGEITLRTNQTFYEIHGNRTDRLLQLLNIMQGHHYIEIARRDPKQRKFMHGWLRRC